MNEDGQAKLSLARACRPTISNYGVMLGVLRDTLCALAMVLPLWNGLTELELLNALQGKPQPEGQRSFVKRLLHFLKTLRSRLESYLHNGFLAKLVRTPSKPSGMDCSAECDCGRNSEAEAFR